MNISYPVRAKRTAVYDAVCDAEGNLLTFIGMSDKSRALAQHIADLMNIAYEISGGKTPAMAVSS